MTSKQKLIELTDDELEAMLQEAKHTTNGLPEQEAKSLRIAILFEQVDRAMRKLQEIVMKAEAEAITKLEQKIAGTQAELAVVRSEITQIDARIFADEKHTFTLIFKGGQQALVEVYGAPTQDHARNRISHAFKNCHYTVLDDDQSNGRAAGTYRCWFSSVAQEAQPHHQAIAVTQEDN
jgi:hypothetical protein